MDLGSHSKGTLVMSSFCGVGLGIAQGLAADGCRDPVREPVSAATFLASHVTDSLIRSGCGAIRSI